MDSRIAVLGQGLIGRAWAIGFARAGADVTLWDGVEGVADAAPALIAPLVEEMATRGLLFDPVDAVMARLHPCENIAASLEGAVHVQENTPEKLEIKREVLGEIDRLAAPDAVIASSTSGLLPSAMFEGLEGAHRCLVAHPLNPPHLLPAVELVPGPQTDAATLAACHATMQAAGHSLITLKREIPGFVMNRLQGALLDEAFRLVEAGIADPEDVDIALRDGLALRWSIIGPFETIDLNAPGGVSDYIDRYGPMYVDLAIGTEGRPDWTGPVREQVTQDRRARLPLADIPARSAWRDTRLADLALHRRDLKPKD
ncbi:3-hydroxyacyl-CoA dehydrogenase [Oceaniglobus trochenteri]|uniref:3-hydroxyacyl-CoA dehydrogenase n=1 Tax=Oceaniglobus trochenteri TaxID=2763260 RepID=UPI001CFF5631|nr:3-hydroxyacyl-CoA dehydrogenase [Oceaniglobus trochenteri]